ncbi:MAG: anhydro-N-acetylmuramic acid kinase [Spirochaetae bacterium HGW-Spirochaetae-8]|nr:MAG: anhydro-N-acetylmuramic acid kinase [Spirochaetae bacterium HGW-Spirochaetae-8]
MLICDLAKKEQKLVIGLMSGTSTDGIDAVLVQIQGNGKTTKVHQVAFTTIPFPDPVRTRILAVASGSFGGSEEICRLNFLIGELSAEACVAVCDLAGIRPELVDLVGSHGQTVFHAPVPREYLGRTFASTLQVGEPSVIAERLGCLVVSDFRVRDTAAQGQGAPLVPYTEYLLYQDPTRTIALQNLGGIGNITILPQGGALDDIVAFDTGPGNMVMDALTAMITRGNRRFDIDGRIAVTGTIQPDLLNWMLDDPYLSEPIPKTTGRERYGSVYVDTLVRKAEQLRISLIDTLATANRFTAETIRVGVERFCPIKPTRMVVGGGGSQNPVLLANLRACLPDCEVLLNEDLGLDSGAKEAVAFAILANEAIHGIPNNAPKATGASHPVVMGKISQ